MNDKQRFSSVWESIEDTPQQATSMRARSELMMNLTEVIREKGMTQVDAAALFGVTQRIRIDRAKPRSDPFVGRARTT